MDETDLILCRMLLTNSRTPYRVLADQLGISVNAVHKRIQSMIESNIIRGFSAKPSIRALGLLRVFIHGYSKARPITDKINELHTRSEDIYWVAVCGGDYLYIGAYVRGLTKLNDIVTLVSDVLKIEDAQFGIIDHGYDPYSEKKENLEPLDWEIIYQLKDDSRLPISEVANSVGVSARTARRRLDRMLKNQLIELSILWYPDSENDIISVFSVRSSQNKLNLFEFIKDYNPRIISCFGYHNIPKEYLVLSWSKTTSDMRELYYRFEKDARFSSVNSNIIYIGEIFPTWRDILVENKGLIEPKS